MYYVYIYIYNVFVYLFIIDFNNSMKMYKFEINQYMNVVNAKKCYIRSVLVREN